jgi:hypothetical protein
MPRRLSGTGWGHAGSKPPRQTAKHAANLVAQGEEDHCVSPPCGIESPKSEQLRFVLGERALCHGEVVQIITEMVSAVPFRNIGRDGECGTVHLGAQPVLFRPR